MHIDKEGLTNQNKQRKEKLFLFKPLSSPQRNSHMLDDATIFRPQQAIFLPHCQSKRAQHFLPCKFNSVNQVSGNEEVYYC